MIPHLFDYLQTQQHAMLDTLRMLVELETPTGDKVAIHRAQAFLREHCEALGGQVEVLEQAEAGSHLRVTFSRAGDSQLTLLTHVDTVYPLGTLASMPFRDEGR